MPTISPVRRTNANGGRPMRDPQHCSHPMSLRQEAAFRRKATAGVRPCTLRSYFSSPPRVLGNANEIRVSCTTLRLDHCLISGTEGQQKSRTGAESPALSPALFAGCSRAHHPHHPRKQKRPEPLTTARAQWRLLMLAPRNLHQFAHEDKPRRARHAEIARRYAWHADKHRKYPRGSPALLCRIRLRELEALNKRRYGGRLPFDDAGIEDLKIVAHHIAHMGGDALGHIVAWAAEWMPDLPHERAETLARAVLDDPVKFKAATLGWRLRLTEEERAALHITTIRPFGVTDKDMAERRKAKARERAARWREHQPKQPRKVPLRESRPWEALGISESTWRRRGKPMPDRPGERDRNSRTQQVDLSSVQRTGNAITLPSVAMKK